MWPQPSLPREQTSLCWLKCQEQINAKNRLPRAAGGISGVKQVVKERERKDVEADAILLA